MSVCYRPGGMHYPFNGEFNLNYEDDWNSLSVYEKLCYIKAFYDEVKTELDNFTSELDNITSEIDAKEYSADITNNRKLSPSGDFNGTICGTDACTIEGQIQDNTLTIGDVSQQLEDKVSLEYIIDCGRYPFDTETDREIDGGRL